MKKQKFKSLQLNKKSISNLHSSAIKGGTRIESVLICEAPITDTCSINNVACNTGGGGNGGHTANCDTREVDTCNVGSDPGTPSVFPVVC